MTLANPAVLARLSRDFVVGWKNIETEPWRGESQGYTRAQTALGTTNGAGARNVQILVLSEDLHVLHALPGFWHPDDLLAELDFAQVAHRLWQDETRTRAQKNGMLILLHEAHVAALPELTLARSAWQDFDRLAEIGARRDGRRDSYVPSDNEVPELKPTIVLAHDRLMSRPFEAFASFDIPAFTDQGTLYYDNNRGVDREAHHFREKPPPRAVVRPKR